jgi:glycosyltransferase involved in cell wall biosynthesis
MHFTHFNLPIFYPKKFIVTIHDIIPKFFPGHKMGKSWYRRKAYNLIIRCGTKNAKSIITPSYKTKKDLIDFYKVDKNKIEVVYEGIKNKKSLNEQKEFLENYSQRKEIAFKSLKSKFHLKLLKKPYIFYIGVWRDHKNLKGLVQAFDILVKKHDFKGVLVLGGTEDIYYPETRREWEIKKLDNKIIKPGFLSSEKLTLFYQAADLFVLPSFYEGFGLVCIEALNQGTAIACSDINPLKEILDGAALYFNPHDPEDMADKIWKILISKKLQKELLLNAQNVLGKYDWGKMTRETYEIYMKAIEKD